MRIRSRMRGAGPLGAGFFVAALLLSWVPNAGAQNFDPGAPIELRGYAHAVESAVNGLRSGETTVANVGAATATLSGVTGLVVLLLTLFGALTASTAVWVLVAVLFLGGVQLMSVGVLGRYLAHVHDQVLDRPLYLVTRVVGRQREQAPARPPTVGL